MDQASIEPLYSLKNIESIEFRSCKTVTSDMIRGLETLANLKFLKVAYCRAVDDDPAPFLKLKQLETLKFYGKSPSKRTQAKIFAGLPGVKSK